MRTFVIKTEWSAGKKHYSLYWYWKTPWWSISFQVPRFVGLFDTEEEALKAVKEFKVTVVDA